MTLEFENLWIVTVNWNQPMLTIQCVNSILQNPVHQSNIIIVENGSTDNSLTQFQKYLPSIRVIASAENLGFAGGFNLGIDFARKSGAEYIFIVNNDTTIPPGMFRSLVTKAQALKADISAPAIFYAKQPGQIWSAGGDFYRLFTAPINAHNRKVPLPLNPIKREFLSGCALLIHKNVFKTIGTFDEQFFLYYEDLDFLKRAHEAGLSCWLIPDAKLMHHVSASSQGESSPAVYYWMARSSWLYFKKHASFWQWFLILPWRLGHTIKTLLILIFRKQFDKVVPYLSGFLMIKNKKFHQPGDVVIDTP